MSRGRMVTSELSTEDREIGSIVTWGWAGPVCQKGATAVPDGCFNSRAGSDARQNKTSGRVFLFSLFARLPDDSVSVLPRAGSVIELSASEGLENNESCIEVSVRVDPLLGGRSFRANGILVRGFERWDSGMCPR